MRKVLACTAFLLVFAGQAASQPVSVGEAADKASESVVVLPDRGLEEQKDIAKNLASSIGAEYVSDQNLREDTKTSSNLVVVGGPRTNQITNQMKTGNDLSGEPPQSGESKIQVVESAFSEDKSVTVISGYTTQGLRVAANRFERISGRDYEGSAQEQILNLEVASSQTSEDSSNEGPKDSEGAKPVQARSAQEDEEKSAAEQELGEDNISSSNSEKGENGATREKRSGSSLVEQILRLLGI